MVYMAQSKTGIKKLYPKKDNPKTGIYHHGHLDEENRNKKTLEFSILSQHVHHARLTPHWGFLHCKAA